VHKEDEMTAEQFMDRAERMLAEIRTTQLSAIQEAAHAIADSLASGHVLHYYDRGHCTGEILHRAGGMFAIHHIQPSLTMGGEPPAGREEEPGDPWAENQAVVDYVLRKSRVRRGDVVLVCSVSGGSPEAVGITLGAQRAGALVVAITSPTYSKAITSRHSSGKFLYEVGDIVIDNRGEVGDAMLDIPGVPIRAVPGSGLAWVYIVWSLLAEVMSSLVDRGVAPEVYMSVNLPEGPDYNAEARTRYLEKGL
jgi:uncharacterized phosphosugar-binding protein